MDGEVRFEYVETFESGKKKVADSYPDTFGRCLNQKLRV